MYDSWAISVTSLRIAATASTVSTTAATATNAFIQRRRHRGRSAGRGAPDMPATPAIAKDTAYVIALIHLRQSVNPRVAASPGETNATYPFTITRATTSTQATATRTRAGTRRNRQASTGATATNAAYSHTNSIPNVHCHTRCTFTNGMTHASNANATTATNTTDTAITSTRRTVPRNASGQYPACVDRRASEGIR